MLEPYEVRCCDLYVCVWALSRETAFAEALLSSGYQGKLAMLTEIQLIAPGQEAYYMATTALLEKLGLTHLWRT